MKLPSAAQNVAVMGARQVTQSVIVASAKMFEMLSAQLYSDKVKAVVREISTNAADAHLSVGKGDTPIVVHLPNRRESDFSVRDFGPGLSLEDVERIYPHYGVSTKESDEHATGCLGLGSKSPLAYADSFRVTSWQGGTASVYSIMRDQDRRPVTHLLSTGPSDEPDGLEVAVAVKPGDFDAFARAAQQVYRYFRVTPRVGGQAVDLSPPKYAFVTPSARLHDREKRSYYSSGYAGETGSYVIMGDVCYPVDKAQVEQAVYLPNPKDPSGLPVSVSYQIPTPFQDWGVDLVVGMGEVEFTPSREGLSYTPATVNRVREAYEQALKEVTAEVEKQLDSAPSLWEARKAAGRLEKFSAFCDNLKWKGKECGSVLRFGGRHAPADPPKGAKYAEMIGRLKSEKYSWRDDAFVNAYRPLPAQLPVDDKIKAVFVDDLTGPGRYITVRRYIEKHHGGEGFCLVFHPDQLTQEYRDRLGLDTVLKLSDYKVKAERAPAGPRVKKEKTLLRVLEPDSWADDVEYDVDDGGVYVETWRDQVYTAAGRKSRGAIDPYCSDFAGVLSAVRVFDPKLVIYGVRTADMGKIRRAGTWTELDEHARALTVKLKGVLHAAAALHIGFNRLDVRGWRTALGKLFTKTYNAGSPMGELAALYKQADAVTEEKVKAYVALCAAYGLDKPEADPAVGKAWEAALKAYPLLRTLYLEDKVLPDVKHYIDAVDSTHYATVLKKPRPRRTRRPALTLAAG